MAVAFHFVGLSTIPTLLGLVVSVTLVVTYCLAVHFGHVNAEVPFISSTGAFPPESCIFAQGLNVTAFLSILSAFIWYRLAMQRTEHLGKKQPKILLFLMFLMAIFAGFGLSMVGNFQQVNIELVHDIGAAFAFGGTSFYIIICAYVSRAYLGERFGFAAYRMMLGIGALISVIIFSVSHTIARLEHHGPLDTMLTYRTPANGGHVAYLVSTSAEWFLGLFIVLFFLTWAHEFREYALELPDVVPRCGNGETATQY